MSNFEVPAKQARALLATALSQLQGTGAAAELRTSAELVARGMGLLHQMEQQPEQVPQAVVEQTLLVIRDALSDLQVISKSRPAARAAIESVATALGIVHGLREGEWRPATSRGVRPALGAKTLTLLHGSPKGATKQADTEGKPSKQRPALAVGARVAGAASDPQHTQQGLAPAPAAPPPEAPSQDAQQPAAVQPAAVQLTPAQSAPHNAWPVAQRRKSAPKKNSAHRFDDGPFTVEASLGAHSSSNFYKGLGGHGVLDAGGIFVATHRIPPLGKAVTLHVHLPGGYEFQARGVVAWTRETSATVSEGLDAPPGFGARFTEISPQGRELVQRYSSNREPLFHDS